MAYNESGLSAKDRPQGRALFDSSHLGRQTAGENNPSFNPFGFLRLSASSSVTEIQLRRARPESSTTRHFLRRRVLTSFDDLAAPRVATKIAALRNLVRNRQRLLCAGWRHAEGVQCLRENSGVRVAVEQFVLFRRGAASECSPGRKPGEAKWNKSQPQRGERLFSRTHVRPEASRVQWQR